MRRLQHVVRKGTLCLWYNINDGKPMVECLECKRWSHLQCVNLTRRTAKSAKCLCHICKHLSIVSKGTSSRDTPIAIVHVSKGTLDPAISNKVPSTSIPATLPLAMELSHYKDVCSLSVPDRQHSVTTNVSGCTCTCGCTSTWQHQFSYESTPGSATFLKLK